MNADTADPETTIDFIFDLFAKQGTSEYMGEAVTMSQHMEQSAACATADGAPDSLVISALLHDIGHFIGEHRSKRWKTVSTTITRKSAQDTWRLTSRPRSVNPYACT